MPKLKNSNATFWVIFKHCVVVLARKLLLFFPFRLPTVYSSIKSSLTAFNYSSIVTNVQVQDLVMLINDVARGQFEKQSCNTQHRSKVAFTFSLPRYLAMQSLHQMRSAPQSSEIHSLKSLSDSAHFCPSSKETRSAQRGQYFQTLYPHFWLSFEVCCAVLNAV